MNENSYDAIVVGAGAAGALAAYDLAKAGAKVLILDKEKLPRYKPCGGGLTEKAIGVLPFDVAPVIEDRVHRVRFTLKLRHPVELDYPKPLMHMVMRDRFDHFLIQKAVEAGAELQDGVAVRSVAQDGGLMVATERGSLQAATVIGADGADGVVARSQGLMGDVRHLVAWETEVEPEGDGMAPWAGTAQLDLGTLPASYAWTFPKKERLSIGAGGHSRVAKHLKRYCADFVDRQSIGAHHVVLQRGHRLPLRRAGSPIHRGRVALVGDAAGLVDAFTGEGIYWALASGRLAAASALEVLGGREATLAGYERKVDAGLMPELIDSRRWVNIYLWCPGLCYQLLRRSSRFWDATARVLRGEKTYASIERALGPLSFLSRFLRDPM